MRATLSFWKNGDQPGRETIVDFDVSDDGVWLTLTGEGEITLTAKDLEDLTVFLNEQLRPRS